MVALREVNDYGWCRPSLYRTTDTDCHTHTVGPTPRRAFVYYQCFLISLRPALAIVKYTQIVCEQYLIQRHPVVFYCLRVFTLGEGNATDERNTQGEPKGSRAETET